MKKYIKNISLLALVVALVSCTDNSSDDINLPAASGNTTVSKSITRLDTNYDIPVDVVLKDGVTVTAIKVYQNTATTGKPIQFDSTKLIGDAKITAGTTATINSAGLGDFSKFPVRNLDGTITIKTRPTGTMPLAFVTTYSDGTTLTTTSTLTVGKGIVWKTLDAGALVTNGESGVSEIKYLDNPKIPVSINYALAQKSTTTLTSVTLEILKNNVSVSITNVDKVKGSRDVTNDVKSMNLVPGDILTYIYKVTTSTGQTDSITSAIDIVSQPFGTEKVAILSDDISTNKFNLKSGMNYVNTDTSNGEIVFKTPFGISKEGTTVIDFVKSNTTDFEMDGLSQVKTVYDAGTKVTSLTGLAKGDIVIYKIVRGTVISYGMIKVGDVNSTTLNTTTTNSFGIAYKEGTFL
jgi:hypothetical protein